MAKRITNTKELQERCTKMLPKGIPAEAIASVEYDEYNAGGTGAYWVYLVAGYQDGTQCHTIHEDTLAELKRALHDVEIWPDDPDLDTKAGYGYNAASEAVLALREPPKPQLPAIYNHAEMLRSDYRPARREVRRIILQNREVLANTYHNSKTPSDAVRDLADLIGCTAARITVAEAINSVGPWDGRISKASRDWALNLPGAATPDQLREADIYSLDSIHPSHIEQLARAAQELPYPPTTH